MLSSLRSRFIPIICLARSWSHRHTPSRSSSFSSGWKKIRTFKRTKSCLRTKSPSSLGTRASRRWRLYPML